MPSTSTDRLSGVSTSTAVKAPCKSVTTTAITQSGEQTIGSVALVDGDRYLYALSSANVLNGIWVVRTGAHERAKDFNGTRDVVTGTVILVKPGGGQAQWWEVTTTGAIVPGTTAIAISQHTPEELALRGDLANEADAVRGAYLVVQGPSVAYANGPRVANYLKSYITPLAFAGCTGDGVADDSTYLAAALAAGKKEVVIPGGYTFLVDGDLSVPTGMRIVGEGKVKKKTGTIKPVFLLADGGIDITFEGFTIDGSKASYSSGNAVPAILGHLCQWVKIHHMNFENIIDVGVKIRNCGYLELIGGRFYNIGENGVEIKNYDADPRTGIAYVGTLPAVQGAHRIEGAWFGKIDNGTVDGSGDGCGILIASTFAYAGTKYPVKGVGVVNCDFLNVKRGVWVENNDSGCESEDVQVLGNRFRGDVTSFGGLTYIAIGGIGVKQMEIAHNNIKNMGNFAPTSDKCTGVTIGGLTNGVRIIDNAIVDDRVAADRMDYAIKLNAGANIDMRDNLVSGGSEGQILVDAAVTTYSGSGNRGDGTALSWGNTLSMTFKLQNIPGTATTPLTPEGYADDTDATFPMPVRLVGVSVKLNTAIATGTITFKPYTNGVSRSNLDVATADFGVGTIGTKVIGVTSGVTIAAGALVRVNAVTVGFTPTTADALVTLIFDTDYKE